MSTPERLIGTTCRACFYRVRKIASKRPQQKTYEASTRRERGPYYARRNACSEKYPFGSVHTAAGDQPAVAASVWNDSTVYL